MYTVCHGLFAVPFGIIGRLRSAVCCSSWLAIIPFEPEHNISFKTANAPHEHSD